MTTPRLAAIALTAFLSVLWHSHAEDIAFTPEEQPLTVGRAGTAESAAAVLSARQLALFGLDKRDFAGEIPGMGAIAPSLRTLVDEMAAKRCEDIWYAILQQGSTAASRTGIGGLSFQSDVTEPADVEAFLSEMGLFLNGKGMEVRHADDGLRRVLIYPDGKTLRQSLLGAGLPAEGWRGSLHDFLGGKCEGIGVWINPRPLMGILTLFAGFDARGYFNRFGLSSPSAIRLDLFRTDADLGIALQLDNFVPDFPSGNGEAYAIGCGVENPLLEVQIPLFDRLWKMARVKVNPFFFANINILSLLPRSITVTVWRNSAGELAWAAVALLPEGERSLGQIRRVESWLQYLANTSPDIFGIEAIESRWGDALHHIRVADFACYMGVAKMETADGDNTAVILSGNSTDWPNPFDLTAKPAASICEWQANLDAEAKREATNALVAVARKNGLDPFPADMVTKLLPDADSGHVRLEGESLAVLSRHGLLPLLIPGVVDALRQRFGVSEEMLTQK